MERLKYIAKYLLVNIFRKLPKHKYKLTRFYKSKTRYLSYLFVISCLITIPAQFLFYFTSSFYYLSTNFVDSIEDGSPQEEAESFSHYNELFTYTFKEGYIDKLLKSHYKLTDADLIYKLSKQPYSVERHGLMTYKLHNQNVLIHSMTINNQTFLSGIPEKLFYQCLENSYRYEKEILFVNTCSRFMMIALTLSNFNPIKDKVDFKDGSTIEINYSDGKTLNIDYGDTDYVRKFYIRKGSD